MACNNNTFMIQDQQVFWTILTSPNNIQSQTSENVALDVRPVKIQISLHIHAVWSESSQGTFLAAKDAKFFMQTVKTLQAG